jgi:hypothetical protein
MLLSLSSPSTWGHVTYECLVWGCIQLYAGDSSKPFIMRLRNVRMISLRVLRVLGWCLYQALQHEVTLRTDDLFEGASSFILMSLASPTSWGYVKYGWLVWVCIELYVDVSIKPFNMRLLNVRMISLRVNRVVCWCLYQAIQTLVT